MTKNNTITLPRSVVEQALEALFMYKPMVAGVTFQHGLDAMTSLRAALDQPQGEQEPVSWKWRYEDGELSDISFESRAECERRFTGYKGKSAPLYTHPHPPRQPLTDDQIDALEWSVPQPGEDGAYLAQRRNVRAIERAHGIGCEA